MSNVKKKVLLICHSSSATGGAEDDFESMLKYLFSKGDKYVIHAMFPKGPRSEKYASYCDKTGFLTWGFFPVIYCGVLPYLKYFVKFFVQFYELRKFTSDNKYDLCIINVTVLLWPVIILKLFHSRVLVLIKETIEPKIFRKIIYKILSYFGDYFVPNSRVIGDEFVSITGNRNLTTVYSAVENDEETPSPTEADTEKEIGKEIFQYLKDENIFKLCCVGNIKKIKNQLLILRALNLLSSTDCLNKMKLFLIGDVNEESEYYGVLKRYVIKNSLEDKVFFLGKLSKPFTIKLYEYFDSLIISSISEGIPLVLVYALKFKKFIITTNTGGISDVIRNGINGFLVDSSIENMSKALTELCSNRNKFMYLLNNGYKTYLEKFNWVRNMQELERIVDKLIV